MNSRDLKSTSWLLSIALLSLLPACSGGLHQRGQHEFGLSGSFGKAFGGENIWPNGQGRADNAGVTIDYGYYAADRVAVLGKLTPYRVYNQSDGDVYTGEFQLGLRWHFAEFELGELPVGLYAEVLGGLLHGAKSVPEDGSHMNFTQDTGLGVELKLAENVHWRSGYRLRHLSNGRIFRSDSNPSQNDHQVYTGIAFTLP